MVSENLTEIQARLLQFLKESFYSTGSMPTLREMCSAMGWKAVGTAQDMVQALIQKGFLIRDSQKARGLRLSDAESFRAVPLLGSAPAGLPIESVESHEGNVIVPAQTKGAVFAVSVRGQSMIEADIQDGDTVIVRQTPVAESGQIVVAMLEGEVTIKKLERKEGAWWLVPANKQFKARKVEREDFKILGRVIGLHRYF